MQATHLFFFVCIEIPEDTYIFVGMTYFFVASLKKKKCLEHNVRFGDPECEVLL